MKMATDNHELAGAALEERSKVDWKRIRFRAALQHIVAAPK